MPLNQKTLAEKKVRNTSKLTHQKCIRSPDLKPPILTITQSELMAILTPMHAIAF
ncbi:hypothetical protein [Nostoc sp. PCC 7524]|uniref:hypothetical protein n=1 Tax=Nostoc sp. (strain ATCC 29411 / PCC 7524) TaxID=28072 RepID=UPI000A43CFA8|nr:hypothetical protein [Nostoc sp. PCC 7524]